MMRDKISIEDGVFFHLTKSVVITSDADNNSEYTISSSNIYDAYYASKIVDFINIYSEQSHCIESVPNINSYYFMSNILLLLYGFKCDNIDIEVEDVLCDSGQNNFYMFKDSVYYPRLYGDKFDKIKLSSLLNYSNCIINAHDGVNYKFALLVSKYLHIKSKYLSTQY